MKIIRETQSNIREEGVAIKEKYTPNNNRKNPNTKGVTKGVKYSDKENFIIAAMVRMHHKNKRILVESNEPRYKDVNRLAKLFNRTPGSIRGTMGNANYELFKIGKMIHSSKSMKKQCIKVAELSFPLLIQKSGDLIGDYEPNELYNSREN